MTCPGSYRKSVLPQIFNNEADAERRRVDLNDIVHPKEWADMSHINDSSQIDDCFKVLLDYKAFCNVSRAGTGKSYNIMRIEEKFKERFPDATIIKIAFTNKAAINIGGTTIHKFLKLDSSLKITSSAIKVLKHKTVLIMVDEMSMISKDLWRLLVEVKRHLPKSYWILCGDYRQVPPVEKVTKWLDYFNCSAVKYLANYTRIEFKVRQRYDEHLWDAAEIVWNDGIIPDTVKRVKEDIDFLKGKRIIVYTNATRKRLNKLLNDLHSADEEDVVELPYDGEAEINQDAKLYVGCPVMAIMNKKGEEDMDLVNNEDFTIQYADYGEINVMSMRPSENGGVEEHTFQFATEDFHKYFVLNYAATVHKSQGQTIDNDIVIYETEKMDKNLLYTAITRAKKLSQVNVIECPTQS